MTNIFIKAFCKGPVPIVNIKDIIKAEIIGNIDIWPSILVDIADTNA